MFLNLYNLLILDFIAPGALFALIVSWFVASWATQRSAVKEAHAHADSLALTGEDRQNFLHWRIGELSLEAQDKVGPTTGILFCILMLSLVATGIISCSGPKERKPAPLHHDDGAPTQTSRVDSTM